MNQPERPVERFSVPSNVHIAGHPVHPMVVPFPLAFLIGAFVTDIVYVASGVVFWAGASFWLLVAGLVMGLLAGLAGSVDFVTINRVREQRAGLIHAGGNILALIIAGVNAGLRAGAPVLTGPFAIVGIVLSALTAGILLVTLWYGGELIYRHRVAVLRPPFAVVEEEQPRRAA
ncbi:MAG: DUF2231 domain-containing protein [Chloroflexi bacterium]|nr:DUF2231 domain-containing protein [Chloroflexota bacterium]